jgi:pyruvate carboxylase subunit B
VAQSTKGRLAVSSVVAIVGANRLTIDFDAGHLLIEGKKVPAVLHHLPNGLHQLTIGAKTYELFCERHSDTQFDIWINHFIIPVTLEDARTQLLRHAGQLAATGEKATIVMAPMPGLVRAIEVSIGEIVEPGKGLLILEAMKMENEIRSTVHGRIREINVSIHMTVEKSQQLLVIDPVR